MSHREIVSGTRTSRASKVLRGIGRVLTGVTAIIAGSLILIGGAPLLFTAIAIGTIVAGAATIVNGAADIGEGFTGYNFMRDGLFGGNQTAYNWYSGATEALAVVGTMICFGYASKHYIMRGEVSGTAGSRTLEAGTQLDRYGGQYGRYLTNPGTPIEKVAVTTGNSKVLNSYIVLKPFKVKTGIVAKAYGQIGGGKQYFTWRSVKKLIKRGYLKKL